MGKSRKVVKEESVMDWPFEIDVDLRSSPKTKVAFMSSQSRTYFPEDPGVSRFGIYYAMNCAPGDIPNPKYFPSDDRLQKPISTKGFGIGGLTGPRFIKESRLDNPAPNAYQEEISIPRAKKNKKTESKKNKAKSQFHDDDDPSHSDPTITPLERNRLRQLCMQTFIGFGAHLSVPRFGRDPKFNNVGVGYYDLRRNPVALAQLCSFGNGSASLLPPTVTRCNYKEYDKCFGCDTELKTVDYYRTRMKVPDPKQKKEDQFRTWTNEDERPTPENRNVLLDQKITTNTQDMSSSLPKTKLIHISLCRKCYCKGMRGDSKIWDRSQLLWLFQKTRHCCYIHDHRNIPEFIHKTNCSYICKIQLKEALMAKYYKDACERVLKEK